MGDRPAGVLGRARELEGLGAVEGGRGADLARLVRLELFSIWIASMGFDLTYGCALLNCLGGRASAVAGLGLAYCPLVSSPGAKFQVCQMKHCDQDAAERAEYPLHVVLQSISSKLFAAKNSTHAYTHTSQNLTVLQLQPGTCVKSTRKITYLECSREPWLLSSGAVVVIVAVSSVEYLEWLRLAGRKPYKFAVWVT